MNTLCATWPFRLSFFMGLFLLLLSGSVMGGRVAVSNVLTIYGVVPSKIRLDSVPNVVSLSPRIQLSTTQTVGEVSVDAYQVKQYKFSLFSLNNGRIISSDDSAVHQSLGYDVSVLPRDGSVQKARLSARKLTRSGVDVVFPQPQSETQPVLYTVSVKVSPAHEMQKTDLSDKLTFQIAAL